MSASLRKDIAKSGRQTNTGTSGFIRAAVQFGAEQTLAGRAEIINGKLALKAS